MTTLLRWQASTDSAERRGMATFTRGGDQVLQVRLESFADAKAIDDLIDLVVLRAKRATRAACASYVRTAAAQLEHAE